MNRTQAMKEGKRLFGKNAVVRDYGHKSSPELRAKAREVVTALRAIPPAERTREQRKALNEALGWALYHRFTVGELNTGGPFVFMASRGWGDTWAEAFDKVEPMYKKLAA